MADLNPNKRVSLLSRLSRRGSKVCAYIPVNIIRSERQTTIWITLRPLGTLLPLPSRLGSVLVGLKE